MALKPESVKKAFQSPQGLLDVYLAVKHVLLLLSDYCIKKCLLENLGQKCVLNISVFVLPVLAHKRMRNAQKHEKWVAFNNA